MSKEYEEKVKKAQEDYQQQVRQNEERLNQYSKEERKEILENYKEQYFSENSGDIVSEVNLEASKIQDIKTNKKPKIKFNNTDTIKEINYSASKELSPVREINGKIFNVLDANGNIKKDQLVVGATKVKVNFNDTRDVKVEKNLSGFKKVLAIIGIIKRTKVIKENFKNTREEIRPKKGLLSDAGEFTDKAEDIQKFLAENKNLRLADINGKRVGHLDQNGKISFNGGIIVNKEKIFIHKNGELADIRIKNWEQEISINQKGEIVQDEDIGADINIKKGIENLQKQPTKSALKGTKAQAMKIGEELRSQEMTNENKKPPQQVLQNTKKVTGPGR